MLAFVFQYKNILTFCVIANFGMHGIENVHHLAISTTIISQVTNCKLQNRSSLLLRL